MYKSIASVVALAVLVLGTACGDNKQATVNDAENVTAVAQPDTESADIADVPMQRDGLVFSVVPDKNGQGDIMSVRVIIKTPDGKSVQKIGYVGQDAASEAVIKGDNYIGEVEEVDIDFDGIPDLTVNMGSFNEKNGAPLTFRILAWRWDNDRHDFVEVENFPWNAALDEDNQRILARKAMYDGSQEYVPYYWRDGQLVPDYDQLWNSAEKYDDPYPLPEGFLYDAE